ncbi:MAG: DUF4492 domain-containing protein [Bacteroidales bacterium]|jgi:hypothetical protein|nr:DUF4492 domain-containing protein [Bacteroidales bacterium]
MDKKERKTNVFARIFWFYIDGFRSMTIGKTLWVLILVKLFIMFGILRVFFFKPVLSDKTEQQKEEFVAKQLQERALIDTTNNSY